MNAILSVNESLWAYLLNLPNSNSAQLLYAMTICGAVGMSAHYIVNWLKSNGGESKAALSEYLAIQGWKRIALSAISYLSACVTVVSSDYFFSPTGQFIGWHHVIVISLTTSFSIDAIVHRNARVAWSEAQRAQKSST